MKLINIAVKLATEGHLGQYRRNGDSYIEHPKQVVKNISQIVARNSDLIELVDDLFDVDFPATLINDIVLSVGWVHDLNEDQKGKGYTFEFLKSEFLKNDEQLIREKEINILLNGLRGVTKEEGENYLDFILRAKQHPISKIVKLADLEHNLSDLKPGSLRDKYLLARHILLN